VTARDRTVVAVVVALAAAVAAWLMLVQPQRDQASKLSSQVSAAQAQLDSARAQVASGEAAKSSFAVSYTELARLGEAVPADDNVPSLIYQIQSAATASKVDFRSLALTPSSSGAAPAAPATPATPTSSSTAGTIASPSAAQAATASLPPGSSVGPAGFPIEPFTFTFRGSFFHLGDFFGRLEKFVTATNSHVSVSGRLMSLNAISLGAGPNGFPQITATVSATTYIVPPSQGLMAGASPIGPAAVTQPVSTNTGATVPPAAVAGSTIR
jgi:hypothetical protein